jgi:hypothetical protein
MNCALRSLDGRNFKLIVFDDVGSIRQPDDS